MKRCKPKIRTVDLFVVLFIGFLNLTPMIWALLTSLKTEQDIYAYPIKVFNFIPTLGHYRFILNNRFGQAFMNSILYSVVAIVCSIAVASMAGYAFSRYKSKFMSFLFVLVVFGIPLASGSNALIIPNYIVFTKFGIVNKFYTLPLIYITYNLPMAIWIALGGIRSIPYEIEEAAIIDSCSKRYIIFNLIPRMNKPALACAALFVFIGAWNEYIVSAVLITSPQYRAIQVAVYDFMGYFGFQWGPLMAATILALLPILVLFSFLGRQLISGMTAGAVKG